MDVPRIIQARISTGELDAPADLIKSVNEGGTQLLEVVKALGPYLTSTEDDVRLKGLTFLSNLLPSITPNKINRQATLTLTRFFLSSLDQLETLPPSLSALIVLSKLSTFDDEHTEEVYRAVCEQVNMKAYVQAIRHLVYQLFDSFLANHRSVLKKMGADFLNSYTKMVDGEKDPRNLLLLFAMDRVILLEFQIQDHVEDFFDITFCYFPISFTPPPNDPYGITADDLKISLRKCMSSTPLFAKLALPLFLEKFSTSVGQSMKDLMLTMAECFPVYGAAVISERGTELWDAIKTEILYQSDNSIQSAASKALESLLLILYPTSQDPPINLAQDIIKELLKILEEPDKSISLAATKGLVAVFNASPSTGPYVVSQALPQLFRQFNRPALPAHRIPILWTITSLLIAASKIYTSSSTRSYVQERLFEQYRDALMDTLREGLRTDNLKEAASRGCVALAEIPGMWGRPEVEEVVRGMNDIVLNDQSTAIRDAVLKGLVTLTKKYAPIIESTTLPLLFHALPDQSPSITAIKEREHYRSVLRSLSELCVDQALFEPLVIRILNKLEILSSSQPTDEDEVECQIAYAYDLLDCLFIVLDKKINNKHVDIGKHNNRILESLFSLALSAISSKSIFNDSRLLIMMGKVVDRLVWEMDSDSQAVFANKVFAAFDKGEMRQIAGHDLAWSSGSPLRSAASITEQRLIVLYYAVLNATKSSTALPVNEVDLLDRLINWTINIAKDDSLVPYSLSILAHLVNSRAKQLETQLEGIMEQIWVGDIQDTSKPYDIRRRALLCFLQITRALALLRSPLAYTSIEKVLDILKLAYFDPAFVGEAARGLSSVAEGKGKGKEVNHLTAKLLWAQKVWNFALPKIVEGDKDARGPGRLVYLTAFSALLPLVPISLLQSDLEEILPFLLRSLSLPGPEERINAIKSLHSLLETSNSSSEADKLVHRNAHVIVEGLMKSVILQADMASSGAVRAAALSCLAMVPDAIRLENVISLKSQVLKDLGKALDDPMRVVRREAVECRARWYNFNIWLPKTHSLVFTDRTLTSIESYLIPREVMFGMRPLQKAVDDFEIIEEPHRDEDAYDWKPPHWVPNPVPKDWNIEAEPWRRPKQVAISIVGVSVIHVETSKVSPNMTVKLKDGLIESISKSCAKDMQEEGYLSINAGGLYVCPGLIDCHTHFTIVPGLGVNDTDLSETDIALKSTYVLKGMLSRGFTTIRDVGGGTRQHKEATESWLIPGPRILQGGPIISQTGGHGDQNDRDSPMSCCPITPSPAGAKALSVVVDGVDACLKAARKHMMAGADHIKICSSGGVASLTDKLESTQFTIPEIKAICDTVRMMGGTGVTSHCFTSEGARNAIEAGIWGIEHGNLIDEDTLKLMAKKGIHYTPTLIVCDLLSRPPYNRLIPPFSREKLTHVQEMGFVTLKKAHEVGVNIAYGTDAFASMQPLQLSEFDLRKRVLPSNVILQQATCNAAKVLKMEGKVGCLKPKAYADMLLLSGNPLEDVGILNKPNEYLKAIIKDGRCVKSSVEGLRVEIPLDC